MRQIVPGKFDPVRGLIAIIQPERQRLEVVRQLAVVTTGRLFLSVTHSKGSDSAIA